MTSRTDRDSVEVERAPLRAAAEAEMEAALRERFGDDGPLLTPGLFRGSLWFQAAVWALDVRSDPRPSRPSR